MKSRRKKIGVESVMTAPLYLDTRKLRWLGGPAKNTKYFFMIFRQDLYERHMIKHNKTYRMFDNP